MRLPGHLRAFAAGLLLLAGTAAADDRFSPLGQEATVAIMRHALAPGTGDPPGFRLDDCATQRILDDRGRAQARAVGAAIRAAGVGIDRVLTSQWCRCRETAKLLGLGEVEEFPALNSFYEDRSTEDAQTRELRAFLAGLDPGETVMLVTHQVNLTALTGRGVGSGEVFLLRVDRGGEVAVVDEVMIGPLREKPGMYTLYSATYSRSLMVEMVMAEGNIPYRTVELDMRGGEHRGEAYRALNPAGWIPALLTPGGDVLYETPAINLWLCETHGLDLVPAADDPDRGRFLSAFFNISGEIEPAMKRIFYPARYVTDPEDAEAHRALAWQALRERLEPIDRRLGAAGPFFLRDRFSLADLTLGYWTHYVERRDRIEDFPAVRRALDMVRSRPALAERFALLDRWINR